MTYSGNRDYGRQATAMLATTVVVLLGLGVCTFIAASLADDPKLPLMICAGMALLVIIMSRILAPRRPKLPREIDGVVTGEAGSKWDDFNMDKVKARRPKVKSFGTNEPPTAERIRELADGPHNWVPQGATYQEGTTNKDNLTYRDSREQTGEPESSHQAQVRPLKSKSSGKTSPAPREKKPPREFDI